MKILPANWAVKCDGSQIFKDTVVKYLNKRFNKNYYGNANPGWYGVKNGEPFAVEYINMEQVQVIDLDVFVEEYLPHIQANEMQLISLPDVWVVHGSTINKEDFHLYNEYVKNKSSTFTGFHYVKKAYYGYDNTRECSIYFSSYRGETIETYYPTAIILDFKDVKPIILKELGLQEEPTFTAHPLADVPSEQQDSSIKKELPTNWAVKSIKGDPLFHYVIEYINKKHRITYDGKCFNNYYGEIDGRLYFDLALKPYIAELTSKEFIEIVYPDIVKSVDGNRCMLTPKMHLIQIDGFYYLESEVFDAIKDLKTFNLTD